MHLNVIRIKFLNCAHYEKDVGYNKEVIKKYHIIKHQNRLLKSILMYYVILSELSCAVFYQDLDILLCMWQRWSPWGRPWPRGRPRGHIFKSLALASKPQVLENCPVLGSRTALFFEQLKFRWKTPETLRKICEHLFCFPQLEHRRRQGEGGRPRLIVISPMTKMWQKSLLFLQFQFLSSIFRWQQYN